MRTLPDTLHELVELAARIPPELELVGEGVVVVEGIKIPCPIRTVHLHAPEAAPEPGS